MARITVEDCLEVVDNRFELVLMATKRARQLSKGAEPTLDPSNDKPTVLALREIADRRVNDEMFNEYSPAWDPQAYYVYFLSEHQLAPLISSY